MPYGEVWTLSECGQRSWFLETKNVASAGVSRPGLLRVSYELLSRGRGLADKLGTRLCSVVLCGDNLKEDFEDDIQQLIKRGADKVYIVQAPQLEYYITETYSSVIIDLVRKFKPEIFIAAATSTGRTLMPHISARLHTGLTADCTGLDIEPETGNLLQTRPAIGGNIMATIKTPSHRPQMATVRYKIFNAPERCEKAGGRITYCEIAADKLISRVKILAVEKKERVRTISEAGVIVAVGRGYRSEKDLAAAFELSDLLGAEVAGTRPVIEAGWVAANRQIGLSGRTVKPKLIITLGVSGSVQFKAGMENSDVIISLNTDENANIFGVCHYAVKGDIYDVVPKLTAKIKGGKNV
ncbi:MAG: electron transfer flavoprotein subunit alpha/FixB family protein [Synergistaceae bacterium]|nr:electron transfer flavoprotein subunit alpha/FixB family protein [Synergistaceae bacterium]